MNAATYLAALAQQLQCTHVPKCTTLKDDTTSTQKGAIIGARKGYLVALALTQVGRNTGFAIMIRYPEMSALQQLQDAIKSKPGFSSFLNRKTLKATNTSLTVSWGYALKKPKAEEIISLLDTLLEEISHYAAAFSGKCEDCGSAEARDITLMNGVPGYHCSACQMRMTSEKRREAEEYKAKDANYVLGLIAGLAAAAAAGAAWGQLATWIEVGSGKWYPYLHAAVTFFIAAAVCWAVFKGMGKRDRVGQGMAILLTLAAKWFGEALYYAHVVANSQDAPFSAPLFMETVRHFFYYKFLTGAHIIVFLADLGIAAWIPWSPLGRLPKFEPVFQTVNPDGSLTQLATIAGG